MPEVSSVSFIDESTYCGKLSITLNPNKAVKVNVDYAVQPRRNLVNLMDSNRLDYTPAWEAVEDVLRASGSALRLSFNLISSPGDISYYKHVPNSELPYDFWVIDNNLRLNYGADYVPARLDNGLEYLSRILVFSNTGIFKVCDNGEYFG